jgi:phage shock protein PspC (stress-responsive transcriptional regulator)
MMFNQSGFKVERGCVKLSHKHWSEVPLCFAVPEAFAFSRVFQVTVFQDEKGRFFVSVVYEARAVPFVDNGLCQAFDLGVTSIRLLIVTANLQSSLFPAMANIGILLLICCNRGVTTAKRKAENGVI